MTTPDQPELVEDREALLDLAARLRPDIGRRDLEGALIALHQAGWIWRRIVMSTANMLTSGNTPRDLRAALADPIQTSHTHLQERS